MNIRYLILVFLLVSIVCTQYAEESFDTNNHNDISLRIKRFLLNKKKTSTTTVKPSFGAISALITTTSCIRDGNSAKPSRPTVSPIKAACDASHPCQNGGTCQALPSGRRYCQCTEQYYGRNCQKKFQFTGYEKKKPNHFPTA